MVTDRTKVPTKDFGFWAPEKEQAMTDTLKPVEVTQEDMTLRAAIWNNLGHDLWLGKALSRYGMGRFSELVDELIARHRLNSSNEYPGLIAALREASEYMRPPREAHYRSAEDWREANEEYVRLRAEIANLLKESSHGE